ncbi:hypothetical protein GGI15_004103 [Coemansia interrupta]|uniref:BZIP domain-containing protein n=1 Tax=Coemansia interrupta TaxID=1126814 RepID=A0A9W8LET9_9FUNG|nr:hypothetical protein GGI15_004103 [Coemansia interrupta]
MASFADMLSALDGSASYILGQQQQASVVPGGVTSPALSLSSGSSGSHTEYNRLSAPPSQPAASSCSPMSILSLDLCSAPPHDQTLMFPALGTSSFTDGSYGATADAAALDGWLQQYVNVDAIDICESESVLAVDRSSPGLSYGSPEVLDESAVAAIASALSSDVLASIMSAGAPMDVGNELMPFATGLATPLANIAPQETISAAITTAAGDGDMAAARKKQRSAECSPATFSVTAASAAAVGGETLVGSKRDADATARASSKSPQARSAAAGTGRPLAPSPARPMVPLAPRQSPAVAAKRSGSNTPPGLSVLAKTAQHQAPIHVKAEAPAKPPCPAIAPLLARPSSPESSPTAASAPTGEVAVAQKRQERLIKNRAAALLSRKRKREYMTKLESDVELLRESNEALVKRLEEMERRMAAVTAERDMLRKGTASSSAVSASAAAAATLQPAPQAAASQSAKKAKTEQSAGTPSSSSTQKPQASDCMAVDSSSGGSSHEKPGMPAISASQLPPLFAPASTAPPSKAHPLASRHHPIRPRVSMPAGAPKKPEQPKHRAAGALLMAVLFSFSLFTLPSLYTSDSQISTGGEQSAGILPVLPPVPPRLLLADKGEGEGEGAPLIERVRRSISAMAQQIDAPPPAAQPSNRSDDAASRVRPMTMEQSVGLRAWINHGLAHSADAAANDRAVAASSLAVVKPAGLSPASLDYAMMYCPTMQHVMFGDVLGQDAAELRSAGAPRVIDGRSMGDVDDRMDDTLVVGTGDAPPAAGVSSLALVPTQAGKMQAKNRPKMSFYSPVAVGGDDDDAEGVRAPWEEYAKMADDGIPLHHQQQQHQRYAAGTRQKYLRIDVEVVGSRWVTADKFAQGLF